MSSSHLGFLIAQHVERFLNRCHDTRNPAQVANAIKKCQLIRPRLLSWTFNLQGYKNPFASAALNANEIGGPWWQACGYECSIRRLECTHAVPEHATVGNLLGYRQANLVLESRFFLYGQAWDVS